MAGSVKVGVYIPPATFEVGDVVVSTHPWDVRHARCRIGTVVRVFPDHRYNVRFDDDDSSIGVGVRVRPYTQLELLRGAALEAWLKS